MENYNMFETEAPSTPSYLKVTRIKHTAIYLSWGPSTGDVLAYKIFFKQEDGETYAVTTRGREAHFKGFLKGTRYYFYVRSVDCAGNLSDPTDTISARTKSK